MGVTRKKMAIQYVTVGRMAHFFEMPQNINQKFTPLASGEWQ
jgi:hypothetical protein